MTVAEIPYKFLVNAATPQRGSVTASVTEQLRNAIISLELKPGEILPLNLNAAERIDLIVGKLAKFRGRLGTRDQKWAVQITEISKL